MSQEFARELEERLIRYARIDTQSDESSPTLPSTGKQFDLLRLLMDELKSIGAQDVTLTDYGAVLATIPATGDTDAPAIAFLGHVDTSPAFSGTGVTPIVHRAYEGGDIRFPDDPELVLSPEQFPYLAEKVGDDIITASGKTLLGADDKAGVAIVMAMARHLLEHPEIAHGPVRVCFTPDEEVGKGVHANLPADLKAGVAYTLDGGDLGEIVFETFSADKAVVTIEGVSAHPGEAKDVLVNALHLAAKIIMTLPHVTRDPGNDRGSAGLHPCLPDERRGRPRGAALHPARFRAPGFETTRGAPAAGLRDGPGDRATGADPLRDHRAVPQHAVLAGERHAPGRVWPGRRRGTWASSRFRRPSGAGRMARA